MRLLFDRVLLQDRRLCGLCKLLICLPLDHVRWDAVLVEREAREEFWLERVRVRCKQLTTARTSEYKWTATIK